MRYIPVLALALLPLMLAAQHLRESSEILEVMEVSVLNYELLEMPHRIPDRISRIRVEHGLHAVEGEDGVRSFIFYTYSGEEDAYFQTAQQAFRKGDVTKARAFYLKILENQPGNSQILTSIGQTYEIEGNRKEAIVWLERAVAANDWDYMAHWFLADNYLEDANGKQLKKRKGAILEHIQKARLLNRNNENIAASAERIAKALGMDWVDFHFTPQIELNRSESDTTKVTISAREDWLGFAISAAAYMFEPGYREEMLLGATGFAATSAPYKEALAGLYAMVAGKKSDEPQVQTFQQAVENDFFNAYLIYEIMLREDPGLVYRLNMEALEHLLAYIEAVRWAAE